MRIRTRTHPGWSKKLILKGTLTFLTGFFFILLKNDIAIPISFMTEVSPKITSIFVGISGAMSCLVGVGYLLSYYLGYGEPLQMIKHKEMQRDIDEDTTSNIVTETILSQSSELIKKLEEKLERTAEKAAAINAGLTNNDRSEIVTNLKNSIDRELGAGLLAKVEEIYGKNIIENKCAVEYRKLYSMTIDRLRIEIHALGRRGNLNLIIGSLTAVAGLYFLFLIISFSSKILNPIDPLHILVSYIPRLSLVLFIEVFAYFFLRLYKSTLQEIKYFQNELTNAELKLLSFEAAMNSADTELIRSVLSNLSQTERNFILNNGQTTVEIEKGKIEQETTKEFIKTLASVFGSLNITKK